MLSDSREATAICGRPSPRPTEQTPLPVGWNNPNGKSIRQRPHSQRYLNFELAKERQPKAHRHSPTPPSPFPVRIFLLMDHFLLIGHVFHLIYHILVCIIRHPSPESHTHPHPQIPSVSVFATFTVPRPCADDRLCLRTKGRAFSVSKLSCCGVLTA
jgi:hypothetical protein